MQLNALILNVNSRIIDSLGGEISFPKMKCLFLIKRFHNLEIKFFTLTRKI